MLYLKCVSCIIVSVFWMEIISVFYNVTPLLQISTLKPENISWPLAISGGWNAGDPWPVVHRSFSANGSKGSATPKSDIFNELSSVSSKLPGFISLCMTPCPCKYSKPSSNCTKYRCAWNNGSFFSGAESTTSYKRQQKEKMKRVTKTKIWVLFITWRPPTQYSIIKYIFCFSSLYNTSSNSMIFLCLSLRNNWISLRTFCSPLGIRLNFRLVKIYKEKQIDQIQQRKYLDIWHVVYLNRSTA